MSKIVLIEPKAPNLHIFSQYPLPRLGSFILGAMMKNRGWEVDIYVEELKLYNNRKNIIFFYDDNFTANPQRAKDLLEAMFREKLKFRWTAQVRADVAKKEQDISPSH